MGAELKLGLEGALNMSDAMEALLSSLKMGRVPSNWTQQAYPSLKPLAPWVNDMIARNAQLASWTEASDLRAPWSVWISGLFNPMAYITAILQTTARKNDLPLDQMEVWTDITNHVDPAGIETHAEDGMFIHGCCMEGARWDLKASIVMESL